MKKLILGLLSLCFVVVMFGRPAYAANTTAKTKYPIVLVHGLLGWHKMFGVWDYFNGIPIALKQDGASVYVVQLSESNSDAVRGEQLLTQVQQILATSGAAKVNLIGHSMGGLDSRYVAAVRPDLVASITTVATPHLGSPVADYILGMGPLGKGVMTNLMMALSRIIALMSGGSANPQDAVAALNSLTTFGSTSYVAQYPAGVPATCTGDGAHSANGINFYSWGGVGVKTNAWDLSDVLFAITELSFTDTDNDGMVGRCSSHFGMIIKDNYPYNHLDDINQLFGAIGKGAPNPVTLFEQQANRLKLAGL